MPNDRGSKNLSGGCTIRADRSGAFGRRLRDARRAWEMRHDRSLTLREIGEQVGKRLERGPYATPVVHRWFAGRMPADLAVIEALAAVLGTTPGELAFGDAAAA